MPQSKLFKFATFIAKSYCLSYWKFHLYILSETEVTAVYTEKCDFTTGHSLNRNCYTENANKTNYRIWNSFEMTSVH